MNDRLRLSLRFDAEAMRRDLRNLADDAWIAHFVKENYEGVWSVLPLRAPADAQHPVQTIYSDPSCDVFTNTPLLSPCPYFQRVLDEFRCPLQAVRLLKLTPGSFIRPHSDHDLEPRYGTVRIHIPIRTNPDVDFRLNGEPVVMAEGECWYLRLSDTHSVANRGNTDRVHLVIDAIINPWLEELLLAADRTPAATPRSAKARASLSELDRFRALVLRDEAMQKRLLEIEDYAAFISLAFQLAVQAGCRTTRDEIELAMRETQRHWWETSA